uniref:NADH-ubiquinone oxidoreductase chain 5 n=1 Tax=Lovenula raynerae TaxID=2487506 RepID=A0A3G4YLI5_9MAXI|nr:NADH dehydrogenase subunit 5 [Lovenula raynerae]
MMKFNFFLSFILSFLLSCLMIISLSVSLFLLTGQELVLEWEVSMSNSMSVILLLVFDWMSMLFVSVVCLISMSVMLYSTSYMASDATYSRFIGLLMMFIISMWVLILSPNFISMLLGWDGLGVTSFLLVLYYQSPKSFNASMITALTNRIGDVGLLCFIGLSLSMGSSSFLYYVNLSSWWSTAMLLLLVLVAMTKSAQLPFSAWLPAAMAAPTPVSSLVHSSTLVTAGVYLLIRMNYLFSEMNFLWALTLLGALTMFMAGSAALFELDMKKVIALSTLSQLGLMFMTLGLGLPILAFFHLVSHAYFKAMLFMSSGCIIHSMNEYQDMRLMGGSLSQLPISLAIVTVANLSLCGLPFMSGFFSKDLILEIMMMSSLSMAIFLLALISTALTVLYSVRLSKLIFLGEHREMTSFCMQEMGMTELVSVALLLVPSIMGGLWLSWVLCSFSMLVFLPLWLKMSIIVIIFLSGLGGMFLSASRRMGNFLRFVHMMWFMPLMFSSAFSFSALVLSKQVFKFGDSSWTNLVSVGVFNSVNLRLAGYMFSNLKSSFIVSLSFFLLAGVIM